MMKVLSKIFSRKEELTDEDDTLENEEESGKHIIDPRKFLRQERMKTEKMEKPDTPQPKKWGYTQITKRPEVLKNTLTDLKESEVISDEKVVARYAKLETVKSILDISFLDRLSLAHYFLQKESGKLDEKLAQEEYSRNAESLKRRSSLLYFLKESAVRNLEFHEYAFIDIRIDPRYRNEFAEVRNSKLLASYNIEVIEEHHVLTPLQVQPIKIRMSINEG